MVRNNGVAVPLPYTDFGRILTLEWKAYGPTPSGHRIGANGSRKHADKFVHFDSTKEHLAEMLGEHFFNDLVLTTKVVNGLLLRTLQAQWRLVILSFGSAGCHIWTRLSETKFLRGVQYGNKSTPGPGCDYGLPTPHLLLSRSQGQMCSAVWQWDRTKASSRINAGRQGACTTMLTTGSQLSTAATWAVAMAGLEQIT